MFSSIAIMSISIKILNSIHANFVCTRHACHRFFFLFFAFFAFYRFYWWHTGAPIRLIRFSRTRSTRLVLQKNKTVLTRAQEVLLFSLNHLLSHNHRQNIMIACSFIPFLCIRDCGIAVYLNRVYNLASNLVLLQKKKNK